MRTNQSTDVEKQESTWIYLLHHQTSGETSPLALPPRDVVSRAINDSVLCGEQSSAFTLPSHSLLLPPPPSNASAMMLSSQDKTWAPSTSLLILSLPCLSEPPNSTSGASRHHGNSKRGCFPKKCDFPMCNNSSRSRGFCYSHGGGRRCRVDGCNNGAVSRDLCKRHGGGRRCRIAGCKSSSESGGLCYSHGGGRRCSLSWCSARAKKGGFCFFHLMGDRTPPSVGDVVLTDDTALTSDAIVHSNVVDSLLSLAKDRSDVKMEHVTSSSVSPNNSSSKSAYAIATLLN